MASAASSPASTQALPAALANLRGRDLLSSADLNAEQTAALLELAASLKAGRCQIDLGGKVLGLIFSKASTRTRVSFTVAMARLGGQTLDLNPQVTQVGRGEPVADTARVLSRYVDALAIRTFAQEELADYAHWASIPVINALTDLEHPCQALADYLTLQETFGALEGLTLAYVGDGNNVARSLAVVCGLLGMRFVLAAPKAYQFDDAFRKHLKGLLPNAEIVETTDPVAAVKGAAAVYTDVWASMGQEKERAKRLEDFKAYQVNEALMKHCPDAVFMHCLPARRGEEVTDGVIDGPQSVVVEEAANRMHVQKGLLAWLLAK